MISDYKSTGRQRRAPRQGRFRILVAVGLLVSTVSMVKFWDLGSLVADAQAAAPEAPQVHVALLPLPSVSADDQPEPALDSEGATEVVARTVITDLTPSITTTKPAAVPQPSPPETAAPSLLANLPAATADSPIVEDESMPSGVSEQEAVEAPGNWVEHRVASGESLARIFAAQKLDAALLHRIVSSSEEAKSLAKIQPGQTIRFLFDENSELTRLELHRNRVESLRVGITDDDISVEQISKAVEKRTASAAAVIQASLFVDAQKAGLSDGQIMDLASIFGWDIDFALEIRAGDQFRVLFEEHFLDGEKLRDGPILAAEFTNRGKTFRAVRYEDRNGEVGYFDDDGHSKRRAFIRTPIKFARVSSRFNPKRWHPVLKRWRSHKGVDYAAPAGTPIRASGDGRVSFRGTKGGYGRTVILQHAGQYTTLYAHMSKYSKRAKVGARVKQGQVIGYVGKSGLASGPHLHYEFRVHGVHKDPLRVRLPKALALPKSEIATFHETTAPLLAKLDSIPADTMVASAKTQDSP
ncbi:MAG: peptidoglycan DD-metalloendopeptidase family protein [Sedimenticolaceae bacterium]